MERFTTESGEMLEVAAHENTVVLLITRNGVTASIALPTGAVLNCAVSAIRTARADAVAWTQATP